MMKRKHSIYFAFILSIILFSSCSKGLIQKAYITNPPNVCLFDTIYDRKLKFAYNYSFLENQMSYAITNKIGIATNLLGGFMGQYGGDLGLVYYKKLKYHRYFEINTGYGYFNSKSSASVSLDFLNYGAYGTSYYQNLNCNYHKLYFQPSIFNNFGRIDLGLTLRMSYPFYTKYNSHYDVSEYDGHWPNLDPLEYGDAKLKNVIGFIFEPMMTFRLKGKQNNIVFHFGSCLSPNVLYKLDAYKKNGYLPNSTRLYTYRKVHQQFPLHANFFIIACWEINLAYKKRYKPRDY